MKKVYVWSLPTRIFHLLFVGSILGAWVASFEDRWLGVHAAIGTAAGVLLLFRLAWGRFGPKYSRFGDFEWSTKALRDYLLNLFRPSRHYIGHNPAASYVMAALLLVAALAVISGMLAFGIQENRGLLAFLHVTQFEDMEWFEELHEACVTLLWLLIGAHVGGVVTDRLLHAHDRTLNSMLDGYKNIEGESVVLTWTQKGIAFLGIGAAVATLVYALATPENPLVASYNQKVNYPDEHPLFAKECGSCHTLYPPTLLPRRSWELLMADLENHFGDDASLEETERLSILEYLTTHSAETSQQEMSFKMLQSIGNNAIIAMTQTPFWKRRHHDIPDDVFARASIKSRANCKACHGDVEQGTIEDSAIKQI